MSRFPLSPPDEDRYEVNPEHEAEAIRLQAWDIFVASLRDAAHAFGWEFVIEDINAAYSPYGRMSAFAEEIAQFAEGYGWPSTFRALAQAIEADEVAKREAERRR